MLWFEAGRGEGEKVRQERLDVTRRDCVGKSHFAAHKNGKKKKSYEAGFNEVPQQCKTTSNQIGVVVLNAVKQQLKDVAFAH